MGKPSLNRFVLVTSTSNLACAKKVNRDWLRIKTKISGSEMVGNGFDHSTTLRLQDIQLTFYLVRP